LESDSGLRKDIIHLKNNELDSAEVEKLALEDM
jgi:aspartate carbamoyltransferase regulatory subunit